MNHVCPVCGYPDLAQPPRRRSGAGSYEVCPSCGFQFGVSDDEARLTYDKWREIWRQRGMPWTSRGIRKPEGWDGGKQLASLPSEPRKRRRN